MMWCGASPCQAHGAQVVVGGVAGSCTRRPSNWPSCQSVAPGSVATATAIDGARATPHAHHSDGMTASHGKGGHGDSRNDVAG